MIEAGQLETAERFRKIEKIGEGIKMKIIEKEHTE